MTTEERQMGNIIVIGSASIDLVVKTDIIPEAGETLMGSSFLQRQEGKVRTKRWQQLV